MITNLEQAWLRNYAAKVYRGSGAIVDLGCFVGATTISLAQGLAANRAARAVKVHAYDRFVWEEGYEEWWKAKNLPAPDVVDNSFLPEFLKRTSPWRERITVHNTDLGVARWNNSPIELLLVDAMKSVELAETIVKTFFPFLIPGKSYVAQQDFAHSQTYWIHLLQFQLRDFFVGAADIPRSAMVVFRYQKQFSPQDLSHLDLSFTSVEQIEAAFEYSIGLVSEDKKANVIAAKAMAYLDQGEVDRARATLETNRWGSSSLNDEFETVKRLIEQKSGHD